MSNLPQFLPTVIPYHRAVLVYGDQLTPTELSLLHKDINALHYRPVLVILPVSYHVKDGHAMVSELAGAWKLGPHSLLAVYSPADKNVWVECGAFNSSAGVHSSFFQSDFLQRLSLSDREGSLYTAADASLKDVDRIVVRSQAFATAQVNHQTGEVQPRHHGHHHHAAHGNLSAVLQVLPASFLALIILFLIGRMMASAAPRRRFDDVDDKSSALSDDVNRIERVMQDSESGTASSAAKSRNFQVPMAEFKKRADVLAKAGSHGNQTSVGKMSRAGSNHQRSSGVSRNSAPAPDDHSNELKTAIDSSAARVRQEYKERFAANTYDSRGSGNEPQSVPELPPVPELQLVPQSVPELPPVSELQLVPQSVPELPPVPELQPASQPMPAPAVVQDGQFIESYVASFNGVAKQAQSNLPAAGSISSAVTPVSANSSFDLSSFSLQAASAPFADVLTSMGMPLGEMKTSSGASLPLGSLNSFDTDRDTSAVQAACPKCSERKTKDFSFCLKCGFNF